MRSVTLIFPDTEQEDRVLLPLALLYTGSPVHQAGYKVHIIDQRVEPDWKQRLERVLDEEDHVCVGISTMTGRQIQGAVKAADVVRARKPDLPLVWGGVHPSLLPEQTLEDPRVDLIVVGEGDATFLDLVQTLDAGGDVTQVRGIAYSGPDGKCVKTPPRPYIDLDTAPPLEYDLVDVNRYNQNYWARGEPAIALTTSRGCPFPCTYCYEQVFNQNRWRALSPKKTVELIRDLHERYGFTHFFFLDDEFFIDKKRTWEIYEELRDQTFAKDLVFHNANIRVDEINRYEMDLLKGLREVGFRSVFVGVESGSSEILKKVRKGITREDVIEANLRLREAGIKPLYAFMAGFPFEREHHVVETLSLMERLTREYPEATTLGMSLFCPFPGTALYDEVLERGMVPPDTLTGWINIDYTRLNYAFFEPELMRFFKYAVHASYWLEPKQWLKRPWPVQAAKHVLRAIVRFRARHGYWGTLFEIPMLTLRDKVLPTFIRSVQEEQPEEPAYPLLQRAQAG